MRNRKYGLFVRMVIRDMADKTLFEMTVRPPCILLCKRFTPVQHKKAIEFALDNWRTIYRRNHNLAED